VKKWFWSGTTATFIGIFLIDENEPRDHCPDHNEWGPFNSFSEAKQDALEYFRVDIFEARRCIAEIKNFKKKK